MDNVNAPMLTCKQDHIGHSAPSYNQHGVTSSCLHQGYVTVTSMSALITVKTTSWHCYRCRSCLRWSTLHKHRQQP